MSVFDPTKKTVANDFGSFPEPHHELDASGLFCPEPIMLLHGVMRNALVGELIIVVATDPSTTRDIPKFCSFLGHELLKTWEAEKKFYYLLRKCETE